VLWDLRAPELELICTAWRSAIRRVWKVPYKTHRDIVDVLSGRLPFFEEMCFRFVNFHFSCLTSKNSLVAGLARNCVGDAGAQYLYGNNIRFVCCKYSFDYSLMSNADNRLGLLSAIRKLSCDVRPDIIARNSVLMELLMVRDDIMSLQPTDCFARNEICDLINSLCTAPN